VAEELISNILPVTVNNIQYEYVYWLATIPLSLLIAWILVSSKLLKDISIFNSVASSMTFRHPCMSVFKRINQQFNEKSANKLQVWRWLRYSFFIIGVHLALSQPYYHGKQLPKQPEYRDTVFLVDTSISMLLKDYIVENKRVDRMTMMKSVLGLFIDQLQGNRIGIIAYSENAYTVAPLTADYKVLKNMVARLEPAVLTGRTSNPGKALLYATQQLNEVADNENSKPGHKPALVLFSDVNRPDRAFDPRSIATYIHKTLGFRLHVIGIGASSYKAADKRYSGLIFHPANIQLLKDIAKNGGGDFYQADNARNLQQAMSAIQSNEKRKTKVNPQYIKQPLYHWPLLFSMISLIVYQLFSGAGRTK